jgi:hypothetical protein
LGHEGIRRRIAEIESRIEEKSGGNAPLEGASEFSGKMGATLRGEIGGKANFDAGLRPWNPFGDGTRVERGEVAELIENAAKEAGVDPALFDALVATESAYDPNARSRAGALGLSQLMPGTARMLGVENPLDPAQNLRGGASYLAQMLQRFGGDPKLALAAYNAGPGAVDKHGGVPPYEETRKYVERVLGLYEARRNS